MSGRNTRPSVMKRQLRLLRLLGCALAMAHAAEAQTPIGGEFQVNTETFLSQELARVAVRPDGSFTVVFQGAEGGTIPYTPIALARAFDSSGDPIGRERRVWRYSGSAPWVTGEPGGYRVFWGGSKRGDAAGFLFARHLTHAAGLGRLYRLFELSPSPNRVAVPEGISSLGSGPIVSVWYEILGTQASLETSIWYARIGERALAPREGILLANDPINPLGAASVGIDGASNGVAVWAQDCGEYYSQVCDLFLQRITADLVKIGQPRLVNETTSGSQQVPAVAVAPDGRFFVAWEDRPGERGVTRVRGRRFASNGEGIAGEFSLSDDGESFERAPAVASDLRSNVLAVWQRFAPQGGAYGWHVWGRLYRADGRPVTVPLQLSTRQTANEFPDPQVALGENGTAVVIWAADDGDFDGVFGQRFAASVGDEPCVWSGRRLSCDTGRTGGTTELPLPGPRGGEVPLFGDVDGDGREDLCVRHGDAFSCDTDHWGRPFEHTMRFGHGTAGETALLGDVDGDGRAEACVRQGRQFLCDTGHDGGRAEWYIGFGEVGDLALLGDVDGDGRDDPCVVRQGRFLCDSAHDGGQAETVLDLGHRRGQPLLGDFDADGREEPCLFYRGVLECDTAHDGGAAEARLVFAERGGLALMGNVDGL